MSYQLNEINTAIRQDLSGFLADCDLKYQKRVNAAADAILENVAKSRIVLLSGPSGSGKTTTALKIEEELRSRGILCHTISMDNYFRTLTAENAPRTENGDIDYESPNYMDMPLLLQHFEELEAGKLVTVPKFDFPNQRRDENLGYPLQLKNNEIAIFEGIHALNDAIAGKHNTATGVYISARSDILDGDKRIFKGTWMRLMRRSVRDYQFRGTEVGETLQMWANVRRGEKLYISPFRHRANVIFDSSFPYEVSVMKQFAKPLFDKFLDSVPQDNPRRAELRDVMNAFSYFEGISPDALQPDALIREFVGGGSYEYK